ncbi:DUF7674 family protein [Flavobacterium sp. TMP13]|uniref:DUF7674 family protein n=1 Tax=unclassified Flavobacterium TaxID=196869 RepID=UPI00076D7ECB|nr:hypothetical protein [Flavobacterium sp. TAB 87]KVV14816.1 hypothetical protein AP058_01872 [Flavobacterium sp. TAB 87]
MKTKIYEAIQQWIPDSKNWFDFPSTNDETINQYALLKSVARFCNEKMDSTDEEEAESAKEVIRVINMLYESGNQYTRNAIENEFFTELSTQENPASLKKHLSLLSKESKQGYLKTLLEN